jgi:hypothetical protein
MLCLEAVFRVKETCFMFVIKLSKNGYSRLSSLGLVHIHRDFEVDLYKAMEVFVSTKTRRADFEQF